MAKAQKIGGSFSLNYLKLTPQVHEFGDRRVTVPRYRYYILPTGGGVKESVIDPLPILEIKIPSIEDTLEIWGSGSSRLQTTGKGFPKSATTIEARLPFWERCQRLWHEAAIEITGWSLGILGGVGLWLASSLKGDHIVANGVAWTLLAVGIAGAIFILFTWRTKKQ